MYVYDVLGVYVDEPVIYESEIVMLKLKKGVCTREEEGASSNRRLYIFSESWEARAHYRYRECLIVLDIPL